MPKITVSARMQPAKAIRYRCLDCMPENPDCVTKCDLNDCPLHSYRMGRKTVEANSRMKAIRRKCLECCLGQANEVRLCASPECSLYEFRFGRYPTAEEVAAVQVVGVFGRDKELWNPGPNNPARKSALRQVPNPEDAEDMTLLEEIQDTN